MLIDLGRWTKTTLDSLLIEAARIQEPGERIGFISSRFLGTPYAESTLIGSSGQAEELVLHLAAVDCFTLLDYVEAMRLSSRYEELLERLTQVRYRDGAISYRTRNHFLTDWLASRSRFVEDRTAEIGRENAVTAEKMLNAKADGSRFLPDIRPVPRLITYIPSSAIGHAELEGLRTGDYLGIYTPEPGLDVTHVGICVQEGDRLLIRHASSSAATLAVVDQDLKTYLADKPGLLILRPVGDL